MIEYLKLLNIGVDLADQHIVRDVSLALANGEIGSVLGPSGCGKTTLLRAIAGFEHLSSGQIQLGDQQISDSSNTMPPEHRHIGMVFQDLALFPHLTVFENVGFGLRNLPSEERIGRVRELLGLAELGAFSEQYPHELSGGQQQRVALIRAMAPRPSLLLLDEPFSGQDTELREQLASEVRQILHQDGITALLVTHDQLEAFAFADKIGVMSNGQMLQWDSAFNLYHQPADRFVADFIGHGVFIRGEVVGNNQISTELGVLSGEMIVKYPNNTVVDLLVRPDDVLPASNSQITAEVAYAAFRGAQHLYTLTLPSSTKLLCVARSHHNHAVGEKIGIRIAMDHLVAFPKSVQN